MGRCLSVIKIAGATSLGLLTGSLAYQTWEAIPQLIRQLNGLGADEKHESALSSIRSNFTISNLVNIFFAVCSSGLFTMAYKYASPTGKHPYLVYSALGGPLALVALYYKGAGVQCSLTRRSSGKTSNECGKAFGACVSKAKSLVGKTCCKSRKCNTVKKENATAALVEKTSEEENLGLSYIHVSEDLSTSTPNTSVPGSPLLAEPTESATSSSSAIETEVENALSKKAMVRDLEALQSGSTIASAVAATGLFISTVGVIGERLYF